MYNADIQCTERGRGGHRTEKIFCLNFSCLAIKKMTLFHSCYVVI